MADPVSLQLPSVFDSLRNKYNELFGTYTPDQLSPLLQLDYNRAIRGTRPIPLNRTQDILRAIQSGQTQYPRDTAQSDLPGFLKPIGTVAEHAISDAASLVRSLPHIPSQFIKEVKDIPEIPGDVQQALDEGAPLHAFNAPILNLIPGSYILGQGTHVIGEHPLFSALDVAPYLNKLVPAAAGAALEGAKAINEPATEAALRQIDELRNASSFGRPARTTARILAQSQRRAAEKAAEYADAIEASTGSRALPQETMDALEKSVRESSRARVASSLGTPLDELQQGLMPLARARARFSGLTPEAQLQGMIDKNYVEFGKAKTIPTATGFEDVPLMVPKQAQSVLSHFSQPYGIEKGAFGAAMKTFRTSVLPLSPKWHINNAVTGAILSAAQLSPSAILDIPEAWKMARAAARGEPGAIPHEISQGWTSMGDDLQDRVAGRAQAINRMMNNLPDQGRRLIDNLYKANGLMDNFYRSLNYLSEKRRGLAANMTDEEAHAAGIKAANRVLQDWDAQTPFERQVIRTVFPFYGWTHHILKYALKYPAENPVRASIVSNLSRAEIADWDSGLPQDFQNYLFWGRDAAGNEKGFNLRGMNPFSDLDTIFTPAGLIRQLNPIASGLLKQTGMNTFTGRPDLFQNVDFDPNTGRLVAKEPSTPGAIWGALQGFIPQLAGLQAILGHPTAQFEAIKKSNPEAYAQAVASSFGVPLPRTVNQPFEIAKSEYSAGSAMQQILTSAIKSGDYSQAERYPRLRPIIAKLKMLDAAGLLDQYKLTLSPPAGVQNPSQLLQRISAGG